MSSESAAQRQSTGGNQPERTVVVEPVASSQGDSLNSVLNAIAAASIEIQQSLRKAGLNDILGDFDNTNVQGEVQQKLDVFANTAIKRRVMAEPSVAVFVSEEDEQPEVTVHADRPEAQYAVLIDPLDGSSNIDVNISVGTIFSIVSRPDCKERASKIVDVSDWGLQPGERQVAAGYVIYGASTTLVYTVGEGVHTFTLDPDTGSFLLTRARHQMPTQGKYYSVNEANLDVFPKQDQAFIGRIRSYGTAYSQRYVGSFVADFHRTLLKGGVFLYPSTNQYPAGKLRLLYEANPMAFITEQAGGRAVCGDQRILELVPQSNHQRTAVVLGSEFEVAFYEQVLGEFAEPVDASCAQSEGRSVTRPDTQSV